MVSNKKFFHFTLGPVQGFVAQARRTRDIWAGSYILSYLAGSAMVAITNKGVDGKIEFPDVENDPLIKAINKTAVPSGKDAKDAPAARIGSLPNRFKAAAEDPQKAAEAAKTAIKKAWGKIAKSSWERLEKTANGIVTDETRKIWDRQVKIENQWEIAWVVEVEDDKTFDNSSLLDQRKNLRSHFSEQENGEKCTLCGERQALSYGENDSRHTVKEWWKKVADKFNGDKGFHFLREGRERLCAICTIKRLFPLVANDAIGWPVYHNYPSTGYMCAIDWIKMVLEKVKAGDDKVKESLKSGSAT